MQSDGKTKANVTGTRFLEWLLDERRRQLAQWGVHNDYTPDRWVLIITEELGKLAQRVNHMHTTADLAINAEQVVVPCQQRVVNQAVQVAACCLAMLQESPWLVDQQTGLMPEPAHGERAHVPVGVQGNMDVQQALDLNKRTPLSDGSEV